MSIEQAKAALKPFANIAANLDRLQEMDRSAAINMTSVHGTGSGASGHLGTLTEEHFLNARRALAALARIEAEGWQPMEKAPRDGTSFLATLQVTRNRQGGTAERYWDTSIIWIDEDTGEISTDCDCGWELEDFEFYRSLPAPPEEPR